MLSCAEFPATQVADPRGFVPMGTFCALFDVFMQLAAVGVAPIGAVPQLRNAYVGHVKLL